MRHAKTEPWHSGIDDQGRALLDRGKSDAALVAAEIKAQGWRPDRVLVSSARRTRETWRVMSESLMGTEHIVLDELYLAGTSAIETTIKAHDMNQTLMLLGHNPGMHDFAARMSSRAGTAHQKAAFMLADKMPTAAAALFESETDGPFEPEVFRLQAYIIAKKLRPDEMEK